MAGTYTVSVSSGSGSCTQNATQTFVVGNAPISFVPNLSTCSWVYSCGGQQISTAPAAINYYFDDPNNCRTQHGYCSINNALVSTTFVDYISAYDDPTDCRIRNFYCPGSGALHHSTTGEYHYNYYPSSCVVETECPDESVFIEESGYGWPEENHFDIVNGNCFFTVGGCCVPIFEDIAVETPPDPDVNDCFIPNWNTVENAILDIVCQTNNPGCLGECLRTISCYSQGYTNSYSITECVDCDNTTDCLNGVVSTNDLSISTFIKFAMPRKKHIYIPAALTAETTIGEAKAYLKNMGDGPIPIKRLDLLDNSVSKQAANLVFDSGNPISIYPNPFSKELNIGYVSQVVQKIAVSLNDVTGRSMLQRSFDVSVGKNTLTLNTFGNLPNGVYWLEIIDDKGGKQIEKVVKINHQ